ICGAKPHVRFTPKSGRVQCSSRCPLWANSGHSSCASFIVLLKAEIAQWGMIIRPATEWPVVFALTVFDREIIDAGDPPPHQAFRVELPILVSVAAKPVTGIIVPFIGKAHGDPIVAESPHLLNQSVIELAIPLAREERLDLLAPMNELGTVSRNAVGGIGESYAGRVAGIPGVLGKAGLLCRGFRGKGRQRWTAHKLTPTSFERRTRTTTISALGQKRTLHAAANNAR